MKTIEFNNKIYPHFQSVGFASKFIFPFAEQVCIGKYGADVGCCKPEWAIWHKHFIETPYPWLKVLAHPTNKELYLIDPSIDSRYDATHFPTTASDLDYIFSSHCLEHCDDWVRVLDYWSNRLRSGGILFLYLPHYSQEYWRPWNNIKHKHVLDPNHIHDYLVSRGYKNIFISGVDLNNSFSIMAEIS